MSEGKPGITWFEPFSEKEVNNNENPGLIGRLLKRPQRSTVQIDEQKRTVKFENSSAERRPTPVPAGEVEPPSGQMTGKTACSSPPRASVRGTLSTVIDRLDNLGRSKVPCYHVTA